MITIFKKLLNIFLKNKLTILVFHRVMENPSPFYPDALTPEEFKQQISWLKKYCTILPLEEALKLLKDKQLPPCSIVLTVDDGYQHDSHLIADILQEQNTTATFYVTTDFEADLLWNDIVLDYISQSQQTQLDLSDDKLGIYNIGTQTQKITAIQEICQTIKYFNFNDRQKLLAKFKQEIIPSDINALLKPKDILKLEQQGMSIGSHTHTHPLLAKQDLKESEQELIKSKQILDGILTTPVTSFAYPNGRFQTDYTKQHIELAKQAGYTHAIGSDTGAVDSTTALYQLPRFASWNKTELAYMLKIALNAKNSNQTYKNQPSPIPPTMKKILIIAFYFPPCQGVGAQRTLKLSEYLPEFNWQPIVLTASKKAYEKIDDSQNIPDHLNNLVYRTPAWDIQNHLAYQGKHFTWTKLPDRWGSWIPGAIRQGLKAIKEHKPDAIFSSYPTPSSHYIAYYLAKKSNLPWIAEYRDPMQFHYAPNHWLIDKVNTIIDKKTINTCSLAVFATEKSAELYRHKYPQQNKDKFACIENGFDEQNFEKLKTLGLNTDNLFSNNKFSLLYSGAIYGEERNPSPIFKAIANLKQQNKLSADNFELIFQGSGDGKDYKEIIKELKIEKLVQFTQSVSFMQSLQSMLDANALLLIQGKVFNLQIPAKFYEYIRSQKPIIVLSPKESATSQLAKDIEECYQTETTETAAEIIHSLMQNKNTIQRDCQQYSRHARVKAISSLFNQTLLNLAKKSF